MPNAVSTMPPRAVLPVRWNTWVYGEVERVIGVEHPLAEPPLRVEDLDGGVQGRDGVGVLRPQIDVALLRPDGVGGDQHSLDQRERVALDQHPVRERAAVAFVGVA